MKEILDLGFAKVVVEASSFDDYKDLWVGLTDKNGTWLQDLVHVGNVYKYDENGSVKQINDKVKVEIWADSQDEDWTDEFVVDINEEEESAL